MVESGRADLIAIVTERMNVPVADFSPIAEFDAEFERRACSRHEFALIDSQCLIEESDMGESRFADSNSADFRRLHQRDGCATPAKLVRESCSSHPARRPAANDNNAAYRHFCLICHFC